jgi:uncharacterized protein DUF3313
MRGSAAGVLVLLAALTALAPQGFSAARKAPQTTEDGLELKKETKHRLVYVRPDTTFGQYERFALIDCHVEFSKTWLRDYNNSTREPSRRISEADLERARKDLAAQFRKIFSEELVKGGYPLSENAAPDVLVLRPALVNISVSAPDLMTPGRSTTYASSSGQMTLYLELWDGVTNTILGRVVDAQADPDMYGQRMTSVDNRAAADRILRSWAVELREKLDLARGQSE